MSAEPTTYNVYRVLFRQRRGRDHEAITLVPAQNEDPRCWVGMECDPRPAYRFSASKSYIGSTLQFQLPKAQLARFEDIARKHSPLYDPRVLTEANPKPPARNCSDWIDDVLAEAKTLI